MFSNPFGSSLQEQQMNLAQQYQALQQMEMARQQSAPILDQINREVMSMTSDEQNILAQTQEYINAKQTYENGFMAFLGNKFAQEYVSSADGKIAAESLLKSIQTAKEKVSTEIKNRQEKMNMMLSLLENDPDIRKKYDEMLINK